MFAILSYGLHAIDGCAGMVRCSVILLTLLLATVSIAFGEGANSDAPAIEAAPQAAPAQEATPAPATPSPEQPAPENAAPEKQEGSGGTDVRESMCLMIESAARANGLPLEFFARVIWQESRFNAEAVGPRTRSGDKAQGIAQFMPRTAAERGLLDPFDPVQALPKSAEFLRELRDKFGNLGLAAAAYNAGPQRVRDFLTGGRGLPNETRNYVAAITGISVDEWAKSGQREPSGAIPNCRQLMALLKRAPNPFVAKLEERVKLSAVSPWGVQLSAGFSREKALAAYAGIAQRYEKVLAGHDPTILSSVLRSRGTHAFYQVRIGADTRDAANSLCAAIQRAGGACLVLRNRAG
jgi:soluble lytic murein transglycosylase-like protein